MRKLILLVLPLMLLTASCSSWWVGPPLTEEDRNRVDASPSAFRLKADYDTVWWAAVDTLDAMGYVIVQMRKHDGYLATDRLEEYERRTRVRVLLTELEDTVFVEIDVSGESLTESSEVPGAATWVGSSFLKMEWEVMEGIEERAEAQALPPYEPESDTEPEPDTGPDSVPEPVNQAEKSQQ